MTTWLPRPKTSRGKTPYGYEVNPDNPYEFIPIPEIVSVLDEAFDKINDGSSFREASDWVASVVGEPLSHSGIKLLWETHRKGTPGYEARLQRNSRPKPKRLTREEKALAKVKKKAALEKRQITLAKKRLERHQEALSELAEEVPEPKKDYIVLEDLPKEIDEESVVFKPNPGPQTEFLASSEREVLYGGAAGGGKSYALLADPMRDFGNPNFRGLILRRTNDELRELITKGEQLYSKAFPGTKWSEQKKEFKFPNGGTLWMTYLERDMDVLRYQGQAFNYIAFDELTQHPTPYAWDYMRSRLRSSDKTLNLYMRATTNPGGPGHGWVKKMFFDPSPPGIAFDATDISTGEVIRYPKGHAKEGQPLFKRKFIPASLYDNPYLAEDGEYETNLMSLPEHQRRQLLDGDWTVASGAAFPEFRMDFHTCEPFEIPYGWRKFRAADYGYASYSSVLWFAIDPTSGQLVVYDELYVSKATGHELGSMVRQKDGRQQIQYGVLDSSCWHKRNAGPTVAEEMNRLGCRWREASRSPNSRVAGRHKIHELLRPIMNPTTGEQDIPGLVIFNTCRQIISDLPMIPTDPKGGDDIDIRYASDHSYDALRYGVMSRPKPNSLFDFSFDVTEETTSDPIFGY